MTTQGFMDHFRYIKDELQCEATAAQQLAETYGTPLYVYSAQTLIDRLTALRTAFAPLDPLICFSIKSCQNVHICRLLREHGAGFDVVSGGELHRAQAAGADPRSIVYAGVGKSDDEIRAALAANVGLFNIESESELAVLAQLARESGAKVRAALRVNPDVDAKTHAYTTTGTKETKFGVDFERAPSVFAAARAQHGLSLCGLHLHIGSPVYDPQSYADSIRVALELVERLRRDGFTVDTLDIGGGYGADYRGDETPSFEAYAQAITPLLRDSGLRIIMEPGRSIAAGAGMLLTRVVHTKSSGERDFAIVDAAMTELLRPALYDAYHFIWPVVARDHVPQSLAPEQPFEDLVRYHVVGPVCETGDFLARDRALPAVKRGDLLAIFSTGAYAMTMSSQYNSRPRPPEVLVHRDAARLIRRRESYDDLLQPELDAAKLT